MRVFKQWPIYFVGRMLPAGIGFFGIALYTRLLDPASFGTYALLLSTAALIGMFCFTWLRVATLRTMAAVDPVDEADFVATIAVAFLATSVVVATVTILAVRIFNPAVPLSSELLAAAAAIASGWFELNVVIVQARMRLVTYGLLQAARATGALLTSLLLISMGFKANALLGGFALGNSAGFGVLMTWRPALFGRFRTALLKQLFNFGWPASISSLTFLATTVQRYVLNAVGGSAAVGVFAAATDFSTQTVGLLMGTVLIAGQPLAFRARDLGLDAELAAQLRNNARLLFAVGFAASAGLIVLSGPIAHLYFGAAFQTNAGALLAISAAVIFLSGFRSNYFEQAFEIARNTRPIAIIAVIRTALTIALGVVFILRWGAFGAACSTLIAETFGLALSFVWSGRLMHVPMPMGSFAKLTAATVAMMGVMAVIPSRHDTGSFILTVAAGITTYVAIFGVIYARELSRLLTAQARSRAS